MTRYPFDEPSAPFAYHNTAYVQTARNLRMHRRAYFDACQTNPWDELAVQHALTAYASALDNVRDEEDYIIGAVTEQAKPAVRFK